MAINRDSLHRRSATTSQTLLHQKLNQRNSPTKTDTYINGDSNYSKVISPSRRSGYGDVLGEASFMKWTVADVSGVVKHHPVPCLFAASLLFFMGVEYTLRMVPASSPPFDLGFIATVPLHRILASRPALNTLLAGLNTVYVGMQSGYILWTWVVEGRPRATIATLFMFTFRGILGYSTQLPLPEGFLGSGVDFPVGNVSFFLFYSGHVAASIIASLDMKRMRRYELAMAFDTLNILQVVRLLSTRGHYTIDLAVGVGAGMLFDSLAGNYEQSSKNRALGDRTTITTTSAARDAVFTSSKQHGNGAQY